MRTGQFLSPLRGFGVSSPGIQGLTPLATPCRPYGTEESEAPWTECLLQPSPCNKFLVAHVLHRAARLSPPRRQPDRDQKSRSNERQVHPLLGGTGTLQISPFLQAAPGVRSCCLASAFASAAARSIFQISPGAYKSRRGSCPCPEFHKPMLDRALQGYSASGELLYSALAPRLLLTGLSPGSHELRDSSTNSCRLELSFQPEKWSSPCPAAEPAVPPHVPRLICCRGPTRTLSSCSPRLI